MNVLNIQVEELETGQRTPHVFRTSPVRIGRNELNELVLPEGFVSHWHALVRFDGKVIHYVDLGSTNGTQVDGRRIAKGEEVRLDEDLDLRIGSLRLHFSLDEVTVIEPMARNKTVFGLRVQAPAVQSAPPDDEAAESTVLVPPELQEAAPSVQQLFGSYLEYRKAYNALHEGLAGRLRALPAHERGAELNRLLSRFPALAQEASFRQLLESLELPVPGQAGTPRPAPADAAATRSLRAKAPPVGEGPLLALLNAFTAAYLGPSGTLRSAEDVESLLERLAEVLEAFGKALVELHKGQEQFGEEMSVRTVSEPGRLQRARSAPEVLAYLLDWRSGATGQVEELTRGFAQLMIHQVALLNGMRAGARALLERLGPARLQQVAAQRPVRAGGLPLPGALWPFRSLARWQAHAAEHQLLLDEEQELTATVFGRDFARAYALVAGEAPEAEAPRRPSLRARSVR
jgi:type VI secretion system FHA domain protein